MQRLLDDPRRAYAELERVLAPGGLLCCCFCSRPTGWWTRLRSLPLRWAVAHLFRGRFLPAAFPGRWTAGGRTRRLGCHGGLSTFLCHRKPGGGAP